MTTILIAAMLCADPGAFNPVVKIENKEGMSSGVVYHRYGPKNSQFLILTCAHGKKVKQTQRVWFGGLSYDYGTVIAIDDKRDLAVIYVETNQHEKTRVMRIAKDDLVEGERVRIMGYGLRAEHHVYFTDRQTTVVGLQTINTGGKNIRQRMRVKGETKPGDSGGVLVDANGELVGITNAMSVGRDVDGFFVTQADIKEFLAEEGLLP